MAINVSKKIVSIEVVTDVEQEKAGSNELAEIVHMHEKLERPSRLIGETYKIKSPLQEHAMYITINDIILNEGTESEFRRPFEIFLNAKAMQDFQWTVALTRVISAVFRKGGDITFLVEELHSVFDPRGGYFQKGGKYIPSLVSEIGDAIEAHLKLIGMIEDEVLDEVQQAYIDEKRAKYMVKTDSNENQYPAHATLCAKCNTKALIRDGGCKFCLSCDFSKCE